MKDYSRWGHAIQYQDGHLMGIDLQTGYPFRAERLNDVHVFLLRAEASKYEAVVHEEGMKVVTIAVELKEV